MIQIAIVFFTSIFLSCAKVPSVTTRGNYLDFNGDYLYEYRCKSVGANYLGCDDFQQVFTNVSDGEWRTTIVGNDALSYSYVKGLNGFFGGDLNSALLWVGGDYSDTLSFVRIFSSTEPMFKLTKVTQSGDSLLVTLRSTKFNNHVIDEVWVKNKGLIAFTLTDPKSEVEIIYELKNIKRVDK